MCMWYVLSFARSEHIGKLKLDLTLLTERASQQGFYYYYLEIVFKTALNGSPCILKLHLCFLIYAAGLEAFWQMISCVVA